MTSTPETTGLFVSRTQGTHKGHISAIEQGITKYNLKKILFGIGSSNKERTSENPLTYLERRKVADALIKLLQHNHNDVEFDIFGIPDFGDAQAWRNHIQTHLPEFGVVIAGNPHVTDIRSDKIIYSPKLDTPYRGTHIRYQLETQNRKVLQQSVPEEIIKVFQEIDAAKIIQDIEKITPKPAKIATDLIIQHQGKYILGTRKHAPYGLAFIGGMLDPGERIHECALREGYEELFQPDDTNKKLRLTSNHPIRINDDPHRDPRGRIISCVYEAEVLGGNLIGGDDIQSLTFVSPEDVIKLSVDDFAFPDHRETLLDHIKKHSTT